MTREELIQLRMNMLGGMNSYVLEQIGDEDITDYWWEEGVPDGADEDDLRSIAENDEMWTEVCRTFYYCVRAELDEDMED